MACPASIASSPGPAIDCELKDLDSRNGTFVNGAPITSQNLDSGDEIRIGGSLLVYLTGSQTGFERSRIPTPGSSALKIRFTSSPERKGHLSLLSSRARSADAAARKHHAAFLPRIA